MPAASTTDSGRTAASSGYRRTFPNVETVRSDATGLLNKADGKNRESENPEEISLLSGCSPHGCTRIPGERFETENRQREGEVAQVFVNTAETTRPRRVVPDEELSPHVGNDNRKIAEVRQAILDFESQERMSIPAVPLIPDL